MDKIKYKDYESSVKEDIEKTIKRYPFARIIRYPTINPSPYVLNVIAVSKEIIDLTNGVEEDFKGKYSKEICVEVPFDYRQNGCNVKCEKWAMSNEIPNELRHFNNSENGIIMCLGVPESFKNLDNVILENIKTAENILIQYECYLENKETKIRINAYSHGKKGEQEYDKEQKKRHR